MKDLAEVPSTARQKSVVSCHSSEANNLLFNEPEIILFWKIKILQVVMKNRAVLVKILNLGYLDADKRVFG